MSTSKKSHPSHAHGSAKLVEGFEPPQQFTCAVCNTAQWPWHVLPASLIRSTLAEQIAQQTPGWGPDSYICFDDLNRFRVLDITDTLTRKKGLLSHAEEQVIQSLEAYDCVSENVNTQFDDTLTFGQKVADKVAAFGGSWAFIIFFGSVIVTWIIINSIAIVQKPFDPYPYILLNLVLSCLAALQAPVIMMSQNRQEARDRIHAEHDYQINLKAELEVRHLNAKMDLLLNYFWQRLVALEGQSNNTPVGKEP